ncbi:DUF2254 domain-containing protein [Indiicoccus explosivorum]|uniref:DUF2254 domain-containing protein n=1 Tax=Indiicoccus explosivorum TaxID=1917864 RepID=UPI000B43BFDE|nr:DUF2254 domain-containing protein [Indiicoccus explosivorum]
MKVKLLPREIRKYIQMTPRQRHHELSASLWFRPLLSVLAAIVLALVTIFADLQFEFIPADSILSFSYDTTRLIVSTLISSVLLLSAFTLNILLVVLTTFSGQFSPRMLQDYIADRQTQLYVSLFNGSFIYVLVTFLFINNYQNDDFVLVPIVTVLLTFITAIIFLFFINHSIYWMQVHNVTSNMRLLSEEIIDNAVQEDMEKLKVDEAGDLKERFKANEKTVLTDHAGYLQLVDFRRLVEAAQKDDVVVEMHEKIGHFILADNPLFSYWGPGADELDPEGYKKYFLFGNKELEIQDSNSAMSKLAEVAIKAMNSGDPRSAINAIYQLGNLMQTIQKNIRFTPYLADQDGQVRVITQQQQFEDSLYRGFGMIRHYAKDDLPIIIEIVSALRMLSFSADRSLHEPIWCFAENTIVNVKEDFIYDIDRDLLLDKLKELADVTGHQTGYRKLKAELEAKS